VRRAFGGDLKRQPISQLLQRKARSGIVLALAVSCFVFVGPAQNAPATSGSHPRKHKPAPPLITEPAPQPAPPPAAPPVRTPEQMPPRAPEVLWDGEMLSINAENSNLSDILVAVRARTGAVIDIPEGAAKERLAARLGPGPAREVISTLLSWTDFDYIIQASDTDPLGIQSVLLTPRGKADTSVSDTATYDAAAHRNRWPTIGNTRPPEPSAPAPSSSAEAETSAETPVAATQPEAAEAQSVAEAAPLAAPDGGSAQAGARSMLAAQANLNAGSAAGSNLSSPSPTDEGIQTLQNLYQQRKQMMQDARKGPPAN
jgi:hypothetical protein